MTKRAARRLLSLSLAIVAIAFTFPRFATPIAPDDARSSLDAFNQQFIDACQKMDNRTSASLWADDGADLLPGMAPMVGKAKIAQWIEGLTPPAGAKMVYCTVDWQDIQLHGDLAYEWGINRQKMEFPPPKGAFENEGKIVLILKRQSDHSWKIALESWNGNPQPAKKP